jgi:hypothetical protein
VIEVPVETPVSSVLRLHVRTQADQPELIALPGTAMLDRGGEEVHTVSHAADMT